jgi:hypothetical protein
MCCVITGTLSTTELQSSVFSICSKFSEQFWMMGTMVVVYMHVALLAWDAYSRFPDVHFYHSGCRPSGRWFFFAGFGNLTCRGGAAKFFNWHYYVPFFLQERLLHCPPPPPWLRAVLGLPTARCASASRVGAMDVSLSSNSLSSHVDNLRAMSYPFPCSVYSSTIYSCS